MKSAQQKKKISTQLYSGSFVTTSYMCKWYNRVLLQHYFELINDTLLWTLLILINNSKF